MKHFFQRGFALCLALCLTLALAACGGDAGADGGTRVQVDRKSAVMDHAEVLSEDTETYVTNLSVALQQTCGAQIGVYTIEYVGNNTTEGYAYAVFNEWGLGDKDKNNGILLLLAVGDDDYYVMRGAGLESGLSVSTLTTVLDDYMEPYWVAGDYDGGTRTTVRTLTALLCNIYGLTMDVDAVVAGTATAAGVPESGGGGFPFLTVLLIIAAIVLVVWLIGRGSQTGGRRPPSAPPPPPPGGPMYTGGYTAPRRSGFRDGLSTGIGFGIGQNLGRRMFGGGDRRPPAPPPRPPRSGGGFGGFGRPGGMGGAGRSPGSSAGRSFGGGVRSGGGSFRAGGGSTRGGGAGRRP